MRRYGMMPSVWAPKKLLYQTVSRPSSTRQVLGRRGAEVLVHRVEAGEHVAEVVGTDGDHRRQADGRVHRVAAADPVPEAEHVRGCRCRTAATPAALVDTATKCLATAASESSLPTSQARAVAALVIVSSVVKVLDETMNSVSAGSRSCVASGKFRAVDIGHEAERHRPIAVRLQRAVGHLRPKIGAADADIHHIADTLARVHRATRRSAPALAKSVMRSRTAWTSGTTFWPSTSIRGIARGT